MSAPGTLPVTTLDEALAEIRRLRAVDHAQTANLVRLRDLERLHLLAQRWARLHRLSHPSATMDSPAPVTSMDQLAQRVATRADCLAARRELLEHLESMERARETKAEAHRG